MASYNHNSLGKRQLLDSRTRAAHSQFVNFGRSVLCGLTGGMLLVVIVIDILWR